jgi:hypothetical protein
MRGLDTNLHRLSLQLLKGSSASPTQIARVLSGRDGLSGYTFEEHRQWRRHDNPGGDGTVIEMRCNKESGRSSALVKDRESYA